MADQVPITSDVPYSNKEGFLYSVKKYYDEVWKQEKNSCVAFSMAHMLTIINRMNGEKNLRLSPNAILHHTTEDGILPDQAEKIITTTGLEPCKDNEPPIIEDQKDFEYTSTKRYTVKRFDSYVELDIVKALVEHFGQNGKRYPAYGGLHPMGRFDDYAVAEDTRKDWPFFWSHYNNLGDYYSNDTLDPPLIQGELHSVLITGIYTLVDDPERFEHLSIEIKNSRGEEWGNRGYAWVTGDSFRFIAIPVMDD